MKDWHHKLTLSCKGPTLWSEGPLKLDDFELHGVQSIDLRAGDHMTEVTIVLHVIDVDFVIGGKK